MFANTMRIASKRTLGRPELGNPCRAATVSDGPTSKADIRLLAPMSRSVRSANLYRQSINSMGTSVGCAVAALKGSSRRVSISTSNPPKDRQSRAIPPPLFARVRDLFQKAVQSVLYPPEERLRLRVSLNTTA